jgi:hypothetical protein
MSPEMLKCDRVPAVFALPPVLRAAIAAWSDHRCISRSAAMRQLIARGLRSEGQWPTDFLIK